MKPFASSLQQEWNKEQASEAPFSCLLALWVPAFPPPLSPLSCLHFLSLGSTLFSPPLIHPTYTQWRAR